jgi:hypothetical protein
MRYGSDRDYDEGDLGKFGLGLKTASLSQCRRLSVASRTNTDRADIVAYCWDLAHIEKTNRWEILSLERNGISPAIREPLKYSTGTVILWQHLDRVLGYKHPYGEMARKRISSMCRELEQHIAMVFHRFLAGEVAKKRLKILLNGNEIQPWDPFARAESSTKTLKSSKLRVEHEGIVGEVTIEPFVLPHQNDFSSTEAFRRASGPANWNQQQGFYIYRANRLIQSGGWCKLRTLDEHTKLARIALSVTPKLDDAFKINVAKMRVQLPSQIREQMEGIIKPVLKVAQTTYRKSLAKNPMGGSSVSSETGNAPKSAVSNIPLRHSANATTTLSTQEGSAASNFWTLDDLQQQLEKIAKPDERLVIIRVLNRLRDKLNN